MPVEENMALARRFMEARLKGNLDAVDEMMAPDYVNHTSPLSVQEPDREGVKFVCRFVVHATHDRGELMGVAPIGRELTWMAIFIHRISEGKIAEEGGGSLGLSELLRKQRLEQEISEREHTEQEMRVARSIQQASLPEEVPTLEGWQINLYSTSFSSRPSPRPRGRYLRAKSRYGRIPPGELRGVRIVVGESGLPSPTLSSRCSPKRLRFAPRLSRNT
jgi:hypothetical protein